LSRPKILYAIQGTGNGHVARAREIIPILQKYGQVDVVLSSDQSQVEVGFTIKYRLTGLSFIYSGNGSISYFKTIRKNKLWQLFKEILQFPIHNYDIVINDFECTTAWAARLRSKKIYGMGHQISFLSKKTPRPKRKDLIGEFILRNYAPCHWPIGFHFEAFDTFVFTPVIRSEIRSLQPELGGHYTVYLPAFKEEEIIRVLNKIPNVKWHVFSKNTQVVRNQENVLLHPVDNKLFLESLRTCVGLLSSAGFESPAETLFLGKNLFVIPIKNQYEQICNAQALSNLGVSVSPEFNLSILGELQRWVDNPFDIRIDFPDQTEDIIRDQILRPAGFLV